MLGSSEPDVPFKQYMAIERGKLAFVRFMSKRKLPLCQAAIWPWTKVAKAIVPRREEVARIFRKNGSERRMEGELTEAQKY